MCAAVNVNASAGWLPGQEQGSADPLAGTPLAGLFTSYSIDYSYIPPNAAAPQVDIPAVQSLQGTATGAVSETGGLVNDLFSIDKFGGEHSKTFEQKLNESCIEMTQEQAICSFYEFQRYLQNEDGLSQAEKDKIEQVQKQMDSALCAYENCLCAMKPLPDNIKACVDVQAAAAGVEKQAGQCMSTFQSTTSADMKIVEVPITFEDFEQEPDKYPELQKMQAALDDMTMRQWLIDNFEWYAEQFGYTKKEYQYKTDVVQAAKNLMPKIEENSIVQDFAEETINIILRSGFQTLQVPLKFIASLAGPEFGPIGTLPARITQIIDSVCELCTVDISEEDLNRRVVEINAALDESKAQNELAAKIPPPDPNDSVQKRAEDLRVQARLKYDLEKKKADELAAGALDGVKCPDMDSDMLTWFSDLQMAVMQFVSQITNIFLVIIFNIIGNILKAIAQILKAIGLTAVAVVDNFARLLSNAKTILTFIIGLPQSLITMVKAIYLKKMKMVYIIRHPIPKKPLVSKKPVLAGSDDVDSLENLGEAKPYVENARRFKQMTDARKK